MKRLLIVADNSFAAQSIRLALRETAGFEIIGFMDGSTPIASRVVSLSPDVVVVDDTQEPAHALARLGELARLLPETKRVFLAMRMQEDTITEALEAGAEAVISKAVHPVSLATLLREVSRGTVVHRWRQAEKPMPLEDCPLSPRELEILQLVAQGYTNGRIARELWLTEQTIKFHLSNTYRKLGVSNRTQASRYAHLHDLMAA